MKYLTGNQIRDMWLSFFKEKGHDIIPSASLVPIDDPTLLWINAGVAPLKKYFDGREIPKNPRMCNAQKSIRTNDIDNVGLTARHHTFFEMLGNFSIGDYFRDEALTWACELLFLEKWFGFSKEEIYITYYPDDLNTYHKWIELGIDASHLLPLQSNFWEIGEGPCGPDTEIFFDRGSKYDPSNLGTKLITDDLENDRYIEIWNIVFSQYNAKAGVSRFEYEELPSQNIDTGSGLERLACVMQGVETNYETDLFTPYIEFVSKQTGVKYDGQMAFKVIADHVRSVTFALADGANFSNEGRGYVLRRILRRAMRYARKLNINESFLHKMVNVVVEVMGEFYPYLRQKQNMLETIIKTEEENFLRTLEMGEKKLLEIISELDNKIVSGSDAFLLYDTFGFPLELTVEACEERGVEVDVKGFNDHLNMQRQRARESRNVIQSMNTQNQDYLTFHLESKFVGYQQLSIDSQVIGIFKNGKLVEKASGEVVIVTKETPFYAESGGQISDSGEMIINGVKYEVGSVFKLPNSQHAHVVDLGDLQLRVAMTVRLQVDKMSRNDIMKNHSATHLLNAALRQVLGEHVTQQGSQVTNNRLRFDFNHYQNIDLSQVIAIEKIVNCEITNNSEVVITETSLKEAKQQGAQAQFGEKYGDVVRLVKVGFSKELCGGTHVEKTGDIRNFAVLKIESKGSGIYRIEAATGDNLVNALNEETAHLQDIIANNLKKYEEIRQRASVENFEIDDHHYQPYVFIGSYQDIINLRSLSEATSKLLRGAEKQLDDFTRFKTTKNFHEYLNLDIVKNDCHHLFVETNNLDINSVKELVDKISASFSSVLTVVVNSEEAKVTIVAKTVNTLYHCGEIVKKIAQLTGGNGGGRADFAQAGGKNPALVTEAICEIKKELGLL